MSKPNIAIYSAAYCPYCQQARALLDAKNVRYTVLDVEHNPHLWDEIMQRTGRDTIPQIFVDDVHIGGCDDLLELEQRGALDALLNP